MLNSLLSKDMLYVISLVFVFIAIHGIKLKTRRLLEEELDKELSMYYNKTGDAYIPLYQRLCELSCDRHSIIYIYRKLIPDLGYSMEDLLTESNIVNIIDVVDEVNLCGYERRCLKNYDSMFTKIVDSPMLEPCTHLNKHAMKSTDVLTVYLANYLDEIRHTEMTRIQLLNGTVSFVDLINRYDTKRVSISHEGAWIPGAYTGLQIIAESKIHNISRHIRLFHEDLETAIAADPSVAIARWAWNRLFDI